MNYVTLEQATALKAAGFDDYCQAYYGDTGFVVKLSPPQRYSTMDEVWRSSIDILIPEQHQVVDWLDRKSIYIGVKKRASAGFDAEVKLKTSEGNYVLDFYESLETRQEATSAAITYALKKLL